MSTIMHSIYTTEACGPSSSGPEFPASRSGPANPDESLPLLGTNRGRVLQWGYSEQWHSVSTFFDKNAGLFLIVASQIFFSVVHVCVKWFNGLDEPVPVLEMIWIKMTITYIYSIAYMLWREIPDPLFGPKGVRGLLVLRGFGAFIVHAGMYISLKHLSLSDATMLTFVTPTLTGFSAAIFLKEPLSLRETFSGLCSFFGVILIARPQFLFGGPKSDPSEAVTSMERMQSVSAGILGVLGSTSVCTLLRAIGKRAHVYHSLVVTSFTCVFGSSASMLLFKISPVISTHPLWLIMLLLIGILSMIGSMLLVMGFQRETASRGALAIYTSAVFAIMFEFVVFNTTPSVLSITGAAIIISSAIYTSLIKQVAIESGTGPTLERPVSTNHSDNSDPQA